MITHPFFKVPALNLEQLKGLVAQRPTPSSVTALSPPCGTTPR